MEQIREAVEKDFQELVEIAENDGFKHPNKMTVDWIKKRCLAGDRFYVFEQASILGFICFQPEFSLGSRLHFLSVKKDEQGKGAGSALLEEAEKMTRNHGKNKLYLYVHQKNKKAIGFYLKHEFDFSGIFLDKYGDGENALLMVKELR